MLSLYSKEEIKVGKDLDNYYYFKKAFSDEDIENILKISKKYPKNTGKIANNIDVKYRNSNICWLPNIDETLWLYKKISNLVKIANSECWNFDLIGFGEDIQISEYNSEIQGHYDWHIDFGTHSSYRKISISIQLSDETEYDGGELQLLVGKHPKIVPKKKGTMVLFPSYFLHRVTEVTRGTRKSLVIWISGPPFR